MMRRSAICLVVLIGGCGGSTTTVTTTPTPPTAQAVSSCLDGASADIDGGQVKQVTPGVEEVDTQTNSDILVIYPQTNTQDAQDLAQATTDQIASSKQSAYVTQSGLAVVLVTGPPLPDDVRAAIDSCTQ